jgi:CRISPR-associated exonuclease Cas4
MTSGTLISYLHLCHRKLWLHHHHIRMEHVSSAVAEGKLIGETTYTRRPQKWRELNFQS